MNYIFKKKLILGLSYISLNIVLMFKFDIKKETTKPNKLVSYLKIDVILY